MNLCIKNCRILNPGAESAAATDILIEKGKIKTIGAISDFKGETIDANGMQAVPGFIDVHIQGAGGADILDANVQALNTLSQTQTRFGVTSFLATTIYRPGAENTHLGVVKDRMLEKPAGARCIGVHLEGPFISLKKRGMIQTDSICQTGLTVFDKIQENISPHLKMMTIAPELEGNIKIIEALCDNNIVASFGHSYANYHETVDGIEAGISHVTHLYNAMQSIHHREPGPLPAIFENPAVTAQVISDGVHIHPRMVALTHRILGCDRIVLITDGIQAMGLPDGRYVYNGIPYESKEGAARYHDGTLIGTALGLSDILKRFMAFTDTSLSEAIKTVTSNPANVLGIADHKGYLKEGYDADIALMRPDGSIAATIVGGQVVYQGSDYKDQ
jgi:N-acetylglucosamine-6-phosphate deacetylase